MIVKGLQEAIISEELFEKVQFVAQGKKRMKAKPKKVNEVLAMRGFLIFSKCGRNLTGSASKGNGGKYYYYHFQAGCSERHKAEFVYNCFSSWLKSISVDPAIAELYLVVMQDIFKTEQGDKEKELATLEKEIKEKEMKLVKAAEKLVADELDKWGYNTFRANLSKEIGVLKRRSQELSSLYDGFGLYIKYGFNILCNLNKHFSETSLEGKRKFIGLMFPEKLVFEGETY